MIENIEVVSEWGNKGFWDYVYNSIPFVLPVALIVSIIYFVDGIIKYGYWLHKDEDK